MFQKQLITMLMAATLATSLAFVQQDDDSAKQEPQKETLKAIAENGKLFVIDADGEKRELDMSGARRITIRHSNQTSDNNGVQTRESTGEAIIIGPDGKRTVFELDGTGEIELPGLAMNIGEIDLGDFRAARNLTIPGTFQFDRDVSKFMIGVHCAPVDDSLRAHLKLENGIGLLVSSVSPDSPASDAKLKEHDILLYADDTELASITDLTKAVDLAGEEGRAFSLALIREGGEEKLEVTPKKRPTNGGNGARVFEFPSQGTLQFQQMGPGIIVGENEELEDVVSQLRAELKKMREDMKQMMERDK